MGKFYNAMLRAEREAARKNRIVLPDPVPETQAEDMKQKTSQAKQPIGPYMHRERYVGRVPVDDLIVAASSG